MYKYQDQAAVAAQVKQSDKEQASSTLVGAYFSAPSIGVGGSYLSAATDTRALKNAERRAETYGDQTRFLLELAVLIYRARRSLF